MRNFFILPASMWTLALILVGCGGGDGTATTSVPVARADAPTPVMAAQLPEWPAALAANSTAGTYPSYNKKPAPANFSGMQHDAQKLAASIRVGINIGNTMEAIGGETAWGNPLITNELMGVIKKAGFNAVRLPVSWDQYADQQTGKISDKWMSRVKQVVQYCVDNNLYVIVNIHWDGGWLENHVTPEMKDIVNAKQKAYWEQIATALRDYDEHVLFSSANEPNADTATNVDVLKSYHQTFINAVRSTGGRNTACSWSRGQIPTST